MLPHELSRKLGKNENEVFELTWNVISDDESIVDKMLVTIRDVTEMRKLGSAKVEISKKNLLLSEI